MDSGKEIISRHRFGLIIQRLSHQILERQQDQTPICIIGIQERGVLLSERLTHNILMINPTAPILHGKLDIAFYRDDYRMRDKPIKVSSTDINFNVENKKIILVDDVLYTGRTVHAAMSAIQDLGRPQQIELLCMIDRRFNRHFPIKADYSGLVVDAVDEAYVKVQWDHIDGIENVLLFSGTYK